MRAELMAKYHPDNFEKHADSTITEPATERFREISELCDKIKLHFDGLTPEPGHGNNSTNPWMHKDARFAYTRLRVEIMTKEKDLKYHLFSTHYRWLQMGDKFRIPSTNAHLVIEGDHQGKTIGFLESIRMFITFGEEDPPEKIAAWLFNNINGRADLLLIEKSKVKIDFLEIDFHIRQTTFLRIGDGSR